MKKLITIASSLIIGCALTLTACNKDKKPAKTEPTAAEPAPAAPAAGEPAPAAGDPKPEEKKAGGGW